MSADSVSQKTKRQQLYKRPRLTKQAILRQTIHLMQNIGVHNTSIFAISQHIGLSKAGIYHYFNDKETLLVELVKLISEELKSFSNHQTSLLGFDTTSDEANHRLLLLLELYFTVRCQPNSALALQCQMIFNSWIENSSCSVDTAVMTIGGCLGRVIAKPLFHEFHF